MPEYLYKYRSIATEQARQRVQKTLLENELYFAQSSDFNDPFDCAPVSRVTGSRMQIKTALMKLWKRKAPHLSRPERRLKIAAVDTTEGNLLAVQQNVLTNLINSVGVLSLSSRCDHVLMWSHYADSHAGICLRFQALNDVPFAGAFQVRYQAQRPEVDMLRETEEERVRKSLLTKADFWSYEEEWRIIEYRNGPGVQQFRGELLDAVILGARTSAQDETFVREMVQQRHSPTELFQAGVDPELFRIRIEPAR